MNPAFAEGAPLAAPLRRLEEELRGAGRSHIVLAVAEDEVVRQEVTAELGERLSGLYALHEFDFADPPLPSLPRFYRSRGGDLPPCVFAHGLEALVEPRDAEAYGQALDLLNGHREDLRLVPGAVVLWLDRRTQADVLERAPDFADWQTEGVTFALPAGQRAERTLLGRLTVAEAEDLRLEARRLEKALEPQKLEPAMRDELGKQLELANRKLGRVEDTAREYAQALLDELHDHIIRGFAPQVGGKVLSLPLSEVFLPLQALEGRPALAEYAEEDLRRQAASELPGELGWQQRREEMEKRLARLRARQTAQRSLRLEDLLKERRAVLLGDPGTGKTTVTRYVTYALAAEDWRHVGEGVRGLVPVLVRIANFGRAFEEDRDLELIDYIESKLMPRPDFGSYLRRSLEAGECLVILDGLDEVTDPDLRLEVTARIQALVARFGANRYLVTSRIVGYDRSPLTREFKHATLQELEAKDRERFVRLWYAAIRSAIRGSLAGEESLIVALREKPQIARMAANPLLLTIMVLMQWRGVKLPSRRVQVYQNATDTLIEYWASERVDLDAEEVKQILAPIAHHILSTNVGGVIAHSDLLPRLHEQIVAQRGCGEVEAAGIGAQLLSALSEQSGIFLERGLDAEHRPVYGFLHQTFGEYMAALHLASEIFEGSFEIERYIHRSAWHEPLLLLAGHLSIFSPAFANRLLRQILEYPCPYEDVLRRNVLLAADCLTDDIQVKPALRDEILKKLAELLRDEASQVREAADERFQRLVATRHKGPAAVAVKDQVEEIDDLGGVDDAHLLRLATALIHLAERDTVVPLLDHLIKRSRYSNQARSLRFEGWPEEAADFLLKLQGSVGLQVQTQPELASCRLGPVDLPLVRQVLGREGLLDLLDKLVDAADNKAQKAALRWLATLASKTRSNDAFVRFTEPENSGEIRRFAATRLLSTEYRTDALAVLRDLSAGDPEQATAATVALLEAGEATDRALAELRDAALLEQSHEAISALLAAGRLEIAVPAAIYRLATGHGGSWALVEDLSNGGAAHLALAAARWLALRPGYPKRIDACELLLEAGRIEEAIPLLRYLVYETHDDGSQRACQRLLALGEARSVVPVLRNVVSEGAPDLRYQASLALALSGHEPTDEPPERSRRIVLKVEVVDERSRAYREALTNFCKAGESALGEVSSTDGETGTLGTLARLSLRLLAGPSRSEELLKALRRIPDRPYYAASLAVCLLELRIGEVGRAGGRIAGVLAEPGMEMSRLVRAKALELAGRVHGAVPVGTVIGLLKDRDSSLRSLAAAALASFDGPKVRQHLIDALSDEDSTVRRNAISALQNIPDHSEVIGGLVACLNDESEGVRWSAATALGNLRASTATEELIAALGAEDDRVCWYAAEALGKIGAEVAIDDLVLAFKRSQNYAPTALSRIGGPKVIKALRAVIGHNDTRVKVAATRALEEVQDSATVGALTVALGDEDGEVKRIALQALRKLKTCEAAGAFLSVLDGSEPELSVEAAQALAELEETKGLRWLEAAAQGDEISVRAASVKALGELKDSRCLESLVAALRDKDARVRTTAAKALSGIREPTSIRALISALDDEDSSVRARAAESLGHLLEPTTTQALVVALTDTSSGVRAAAVTAVGRFRDPELLEQLVPMLGDEGSSVRRAAAQALRSSEYPRLLRPLLATVADANVGVRIATLGALAEIRDSRAFAALRLALQDDDKASSAAIRGLAILEDPSAIQPLMASFVDHGGYRSKIAQALALLDASKTLPLLVAFAQPNPTYITALIHLDPASALEVLDRFAPRLRFQSWADRLRGQAQCRLGDESGALSSFRKALEQRDHYADDLLALAHFHLERGEFPAATTLVEQALEKKPGAALALLTRAVVLEASGQRQEALESLGQARQTSPRVVNLKDLKFDHLWRDKALTALRNLLALEAEPRLQSEVAEPRPRYGSSD